MLEKICFNRKTFFFYFYYNSLVNFEMKYFFPFSKPAVWLVEKFRNEIMKKVTKNCREDILILISCFTKIARLSEKSSEKL